MKIIYQSASEAETFKLGEKWGKALGPSCQLAFFGDLASGKTTFIKGLASSFAGISPDVVSSPTFTYLHLYEGKKKVYHFDLYRLSDVKQFQELGFEDYLEINGLVCYEWAERIQPILPPEVIRLNFYHQKEGIRCIIIESIYETISI